MGTLTMDRQESAAPERSLKQRHDALAKANRIRTWRRCLKQDLKHRRVDVRAMLLDPPEEMLTMKVFDLLMAVPKQGRVKVNRLLVQHRISPSKTVGGLSERQRGELVGRLSPLRT
jgi:hypothetical protein